MKTHVQWLLILIIFCGIHSTLFGKTTTEDHQKKLLLIFTLLQDERLLAAPGVHPTSCKVGIDFSFLPKIKTKVGKRKQSIEFTPVMLRPTMRLDLLNHYFAQVGGVPNAEISNYTVQLFSSKLGLGYDSIGKWSTWGSYTQGKLIAAIITPRLSSKDEVNFEVRGAGAAYGINFGNYAPYVAAEYRVVEGEMYIPNDETTIEATYDGPTYGIGLRYSRFAPILLTFEEVFVPEILQHLRFSFVYQF